MTEEKLEYLQIGEIKEYILKQPMGQKKITREIRKYPI